MNKRYIFWLDDISILYKDGNYLNFIPTNEMSRVEQLNAVTRLLIYFILLCFMFNKSEEWIICALLLICSTIFMNYMFKSNTKSKVDDHIRISKIENNLENRLENRLEEFTNIEDIDIDIDNDMVKQDYRPNFNNNIKKGILKQTSGNRVGQTGGNRSIYCNLSKLDDIVFERDIKPEYFEDIEAGRRDISSAPKIESGYYDFQNEIQLGEKYGPPKYKRFKDPPFYNREQSTQYEKASCRRPTVNNPFMNPLLIDFNDGETPVACNADDADINEEIKDKYNKNLYRNVDDLFETENSQRQFFTIPDTRLPNQQKEFAMWLYGDIPTCKETNTQCLQYEDLRFRK
jgi:hypothetical protein